MRKPTDVRPEADLQAIQTSAAFKHVAEKLELYRRQFGLVFLCIVAFSAIHVALVVIANLYTQETRVNNGVLVGARGSDDAGQVAAPVATATAQARYDIPFIMSNTAGEQQKKLLSGLKSVNFVDSAGDYRQYTVTGFKLGGHNNSELKLYTSVGHVLDYQRGLGLAISQDDSCSNTSNVGAPMRTRKLLEQTGFFNMLTEGSSGVYASDTTRCVDSIVKDFLDAEVNPGDITLHDSDLSQLAVEIAACMGEGGSMDGATSDSLADTVAALNAYLDALGANTAVLDVWATNPNTQCVQGVRALRHNNAGGADDATVDSFNAGKVAGWQAATGPLSPANNPSFRDTGSCPLMSSAVSAIVDDLVTAEGLSDEAVYFGLTGNELDDSTCAGWDGLTPTPGCSLTAYTNDSELESCQQGYTLGDIEYLEALATTTYTENGQAVPLLKDYIDQRFEDYNEFLNELHYEVTESLRGTEENGGFQLYHILQAFGISLDGVSPHGDQTADLHATNGNFLEHKPHHAPPGMTEIDLYQLFLELPAVLNEDQEATFHQWGWNWADFIGELFQTAHCFSQAACRFYVWYHPATLMDSPPSDWTVQAGPNSYLDAFATHHVQGTTSVYGDVVNPLHDEAGLDGSHCPIGVVSIRPHNAGEEDPTTWHWIDAYTTTHKIHVDSDMPVEFDRDGNVVVHGPIVSADAADPESGFRKQYYHPSVTTGWIETGWLTPQATLACGDEECPTTVRSFPEFPGAMTEYSTDGTDITFHWPAGMHLKVVTDGNVILGGAASETSAIGGMTWEGPIGLVLHEGKFHEHFEAGNDPLEEVMFSHHGYPIIRCTEPGMESDWTYTGSAWERYEVQIWDTHHDYSVSISTAMDINPNGLTEAQAHAIDEAKDLLIAVKNSVIAVADHEIRHCMEQNAAMFAVAAIPVVNGMIELLGSTSYEQWLDAEMTAALAHSQEEADTQINNCAEAGATVWMCLNANRGASSPVVMCNHATSQSVGHLSLENAICTRMANSQTNVVSNGLNENAGYTDAFESPSTVTESWGCDGLTSASAIPPSYEAVMDLLGSKSCQSYALAMLTYDSMGAQWHDVSQAYDNEQLLEASTTLSATDLQHVLAREINIALEGVFEDFHTWHANMNSDFGQFKSMNNWDSGSIVRPDFLARPEMGTDILSSEESAYLADTYGCSVEPLALMHGSSTNLPVSAFDSCHATHLNGYRRPFFTGSFFSLILGGFDSFSMYIPPAYCSAYTHSTGDGNFVLNPTFDDSTQSIDYIIMLHGWGGSNSFLHTAASVLHYTFSGVGPDGSNMGFEACTDVNDLGGCQSYGFPGGFIVAAPDGGATPLGGRNWWMNSEFTGFLLDYVVFDLPNHMITNLGMIARSVGIFGFSMGAFGALSAVNTYTANVAVVYAASAPMYPSDCFFAYTCHQICAYDVVFCELLFTSFGQVLNSYVILWENSLIQSSGSLDPIGGGIAKHMGAMGSTSGQAFVECVYYRHNNDNELSWQLDDPAGMSSGEKSKFVKSKKPAGKGKMGDGKKMEDEYGAAEADFLLNVQGDYIGKSLAGVTRSVCTYQNWNTANTDTCGVVSADASGHPTMPAASASVDVAASATTSVHASLSGIDTTSGLFSCASDCDFSGFQYQHAAVSGSGTTNFYTFAAVYQAQTGDAENTCFAAACPDILWCLENSAVEGTDNYLDPVKSLVAAMKFVPYSHMIHDTVIPSAFSHFWHAMPLVKFMFLSAATELSSTFNSHPVLFYMHCAQNDEMSLYAMHIEYVAILLGAMYSPTPTDYVAQGTHFVADFGDCDGHFFTLTDMWDVIGWFSDVFHSFVGMEDGLKFEKVRVKTWDDWLRANNPNVHGLALCWIYGHGADTDAFVSSPQPEGSVYSSTMYLHTETCASGIHMMDSLYSTVPSSPQLGLYSTSEWADLEQFNEIDLELQMMSGLEAEANAHFAECLGSGVTLVPSLTAELMDAGFAHIGNQKASLNYFSGILNVGGTIDDTLLTEHVAGTCNY
eukprot:CAMPEP_0197844804 /NCGR_PEP_ID=MMETSP1438-20131217/1767_1 /TAXON_ID=1461541 /ORGANISM="Pterosperma sp., Strain CCMP1384" /LENGTH=2006 /DNA_ID=CAMNT_0043455785 /DNA_START=35 /DNA_END=6055 /DNA_ORIENTATION=-